VDKVETGAFNFLVFNLFVYWQGCGIAMPDSSDFYIEPAGQVDFPG
jgi:hypothetical protein